MRKERERNETKMHDQHPAPCLEPSSSDATRSQAGRRLDLCDEDRRDTVSSLDACPTLWNRFPWNDFLCFSSFRELYEKQQERRLVLQHEPIRTHSTGQGSLYPSISCSETLPFRTLPPVLNDVEENENQEVSSTLYSNASSANSVLVGEAEGRKSCTLDDGSTLGCGNAFDFVPSATTSPSSSSAISSLPSSTPTNGRMPLHVRSYGAVETEHIGLIGLQDAGRRCCSPLHDSELQELSYSLSQPLSYPFECPAGVEDISGSCELTRDDVFFPLDAQDRIVPNVRRSFPFDEQPFYTLSKLSDIVRMCVERMEEQSSSDFSSQLFLRRRMQSFLDLTTRVTKGDSLPSSSNGMTVDSLPRSSFSDRVLSDLVRIGRRLVHDISKLS